MWTRTRESPSPGQNMKYEVWKTLDRLRVKVARTAEKNLVKRGKKNNDMCECKRVLEPYF